MPALFTDLARSTLAAGLTDVATSVSLAAGTGTRFPSPGAGEWFDLFVLKFATGEYEWMRCTSRSTDTLTVTRAQYGSTAIAFDAGDLVELRLTADTLSGFAQVSAIQSGASRYGGSSTGAAGAYVVNLTPALTANVAGMAVRFIPNHDSPGASTLKVDTAALANLRKRIGGALVALEAGDLKSGVAATVTFDGTYWVLDTPMLGTASQVAVGTGAAQVPTNAQIVFPYPPRHRQGLTIARGVSDPANDVDIAPGSARDVGNNINMSFASTFTKRLDAAWAAGSGNGGRPGAVSHSADTWYHVFMIAKADGTIDAGFDTDIAATNLLTTATDFVYYRRLGSVRTDGSVQFLPFTQVGNQFLWATPPLDVDGASVTATAGNAALSVPPGVQVEANIIVVLDGSVTGVSYNRRVILMNPAQNEVIPLTSDGLWNAKFSIVASTSGSTIVENSSDLRIITNTSRQVKYLGQDNYGSIKIDIATNGWRDFLGD